MQIAIIPAEYHDQDVLELLLEDKRSENTKKAYKKDLNDFFRTMTGNNANQVFISDFLSVTRHQAVAIALKYKAKLIQKGLAEATVNRRLAALRSLVDFARKIGKCEWDLRDIKGEKITPYRDTSGVPAEKMISMLSVPDRSKQKGKRDYALLRLLCENALRRGELVKINVEDFEPDSQSLNILGKGKGSQKEKIDLSYEAVQAIQDWLSTRGNLKNGSPLFISLDNAHKGQRISGDGISHIVQQTSRAAGISKQMSPHRLRHSAITCALEITNGNVSMVQKLSRHSKIETLMIYNDRRENHQKKVTEQLSALFQQPA